MSWRLCIRDTPRSLEYAQPMRSKWGVLAAVLGGLVFHNQTSDAFVRPRDAEGPVVAAQTGGRLHRTLDWQQAPRLAQAGLPGWNAVYDHDTDVPLRMWGKTAPLAGSVADAAIAESHARNFLAAHVATLAPGASVNDFTPLANIVSNGVRTVTFQQTARGLRVLGGAVSFAYKADRLIMVGSTAMPNIGIVLPSQTIARTHLADKAAEWLARDNHRVVQDLAPSLVAQDAERVIIPIVRPKIGPRTSIEYKVAAQLAVKSMTGPGRWDVFMDAHDASPILRRSTLSYASGRVLFDVPVRRPFGERRELGAAFASHTVDGAVAMSTNDGTVTWAGDASATIAPALVGPFVRLVQETGSIAETSLALAPNATVTWSLAGSETGDAQLTTFLHTNLVKDFVKTRLDATLPWLDDTIEAFVNENDTCNAYSTGDDIHFFKADLQCENTGRLPDVVYHEFGHSLHRQSIIPGAGGFDGALSEGLGDILSMAITNDFGLGRGFFFTDAPLRDLNPEGREKRWPDDVSGQVHDDGEIIGGTMWDLKVALRAKLGDEAGDTAWLQIFYGIMRRSVDIPSSYVEALVADDDDGDLTNGTPNLCTIQEQFGRHGLADPSVTIGLAPPVREGWNVAMTVGAGSSECPGATVASIAVDWKVRGGAGGKIDLVNAATQWTGAIPTQGTGAVVEYKVTAKLSDGSSVSYPNNPGDPFYQFYVGDVQTLWCTDFEAGADEWTTGSLPTNRIDWEVGPPMALAGDPAAAFSGTNVFGNDLSVDGAYRRRTEVFAESPEIDLAGNTANVHLQYRRWLGVEDGFFDGASIQANGVEVWKSYASQSEPQTGTNHVDKEWRFHDVDVSAQAAAAVAATGKLKLRFGLEADAGLELSGWNLDDVCLVVAAAPPTSTCGDKVLAGAETCDDGNGTDGDGCSNSCQLEDVGPDPEDAVDGGCCSTSADPRGAAGLAVLALGLVLRRRRRK